MATEASQVDMHMAGMPIKQVTLYDNGFAVFQREKVVLGHGSIDLYFSGDHMKSVLDSLQFSGDASKNVGNIAYEVTKPEANISIDENEPLVGLIRSLVGRMMSIMYLDSDSTSCVIEGRILGVDDKIKDAATGHKREHVSMLLEGGVMRMIPISSIRTFHILENQVQEDLTFSLDLKRSSGNEDLQKLSVFYSNIDSPQTLVAKYGFQVKGFQSSYRMMLSDDPSKFKLDGLAIVENILDEDWNDISLNLVVGAPPIESGLAVADEGMWQLKIKDFQGSFFYIRADPKDSVMKLRGKIRKKKNINPFCFKLMFAGKPIEDGRVLSDYTIGNNATLIMSRIQSASTEVSSRSSSSPPQNQFSMAAQENLSYYTIPMHVTAKRKQKAIVPLLQADLEGQKVYFYDESVRTGNPLCAVLFENTTGRTLEGGTLQISSSKVFLGQGTLPTIHPGDESPPIPYCVELACEVSKGTDSTYLKPHFINIEHGIGTVTRIHREISLYRIKNKSDKPLDFLLNHPFLEDYELVQKLDVEEEEPVDITDRFYQFRFVVPANIEKKTFAVREEINDVKDFPIADLTEENLGKWIRDKLIDQKIEKDIRETFAIKRHIGDIQRGIYDKESDVREIQSSQSHLRNNISALEGHEKEAAKYIRSLAQEEDKLQAVQGAIKKDKADKKKLELKLKTAVNAIRWKKDLPKSTADQSK